MLAAGVIASHDSHNRVAVIGNYPPHVQRQHDSALRAHYDPQVWRIGIPDTDTDRDNPNP